MPSVAADRTGTGGGGAPVAGSGESKFLCGRGGGPPRALHTTNKERRGVGEEVCARGNMEKACKSRLASRGCTPRNYRKRTKPRGNILGGDDWTGVKQKPTYAGGPPSELTESIGVTMSESCEMRSSTDPCKGTDKKGIERRESVKLVALDMAHSSK